jgi:hypothetical protein
MGAKGLRAAKPILKSQGDLKKLGEGKAQKTLVVGFIIALLFLLAGCGGEATATPQAQLPPTTLALPTGIPTFTPAPATPEPVSTPTPTLIVLPPTATPSPTPPRPTPTAVTAPTPTVTPFPTPTLRPTPTVNNGFKQLTIEQARNIDGYRALFPTYLPANFKLNRISVSQNTNPRLITVISEYGDDQNHNFDISAQVLPDLVPANGGPATPVTTEPFTPPPTARSNFFQQENVQIRGQTALLSYSDFQSSLSWSEGITRYFINGSLSKSDILKVAESLA